MGITGATPPEKHVAVFAFPFSSHPPLLLSLVRRLASAAPSVTFSFFNSANSNRNLFSSRIPDNIRPYDVSDGVPENYVFVGKPQEDINLFLEVAELEFRRRVEVAEADIGRRISCVMADAFLWWSGEMAEELKIPWVAFWTAGACALSAHFYTDLIRHKVGLQGSVSSEDEILDLIPGLSRVRVPDLPGGIVLGDLQSPFSNMLHKMATTLPKATAVPLNSFQELNPDVTKDLTANLNNFLNIGPFNLISKPKPTFHDKFSCIPWLDTQTPRSVAYICFGTTVTPPPHELLALAEALEETQTPFLWSIKDEPTKGFFVNGRGKGKVVAWAPQVQVLEHPAVGVFVTHGGWNSVLESVGAGVPMICRPFFGDQQINSWTVEKEWEVGVRTEGGVFTKPGASRALDHVLSSQRLRKRIGQLKQLAHKAVQPDGSSNQNFKILLDVITSATRL